MVVNNTEENKVCPNCKNTMVLKEGKYGLFWGCSKYPKCKGSIDATQTRTKTKQLELINIDYFKLLERGDIEKIIYECGSSNENANDLIQEYIGSYKEFVGNNNLCYKVLEYLHKKHRYIDISKFTYVIYLVRGEVPENFRYWINSLDYSNNYYEKNIQSAIVKNWNDSLFNVLNLKYIDQEVFIGSIEDGGGKVDILASDTSDNMDVLIEIKGPKNKARNAWGQLSAYIKIYENFIISM
ncbi:topoisomerase DNA-binding C4 zinc finger domain-containing protein [Clostridium magnum]|uniref:DNA topoisomerase 1 n=1 Tax=Clostridium magnum DSM 2767 TaxID=1121326 RepID=A0A162R4N8_9CLOT|nr:topoisomerase DNA-binding C4 zinc finger domain-containing protein [Clostridium magnum]KZL89417.1 DNA topoisomerase 1 [Clostridium magnum DSM 2767]